MRVTAGLNALADAAKEFAENAAAGSMNDLEILEPTLVLIGDILKAMLPAVHQTS